MLRTLVVLTLFATQASVLAQKLPTPSRTVYRCEVGGKTVYSDAPCEGAKRVDVEPTRGLNKSSGTERVGADVRTERSNEQMAEALRPGFGESAAERALRHKRAKLSPAQARRCHELDGQIAQAEQQERSVTGSDLKNIQLQLFKLRQAFHSGGC